jgi:hypothetical protein
MPVQDNLLVGCKLKNNIDNFLVFVDVEYGVKQMLEFAEFVPMDIGVIKLVGLHDLVILFEIV